jgi:phospholipid/cholesterol/gamma-HCH transport system substrate-binding protein
MSARRRLIRGAALLVASMILASCGTWRGIANVPMPGAQGTGPGAYTVYVQMPNTLALTANSKVMVADVFVGTVRKIDLKDWVATLTLNLQKGVRLPANATAKVGQTSLLGSQHVELAAPPQPSPQLLRNGDTIPLKNSSAYPTTERTLATLAIVLRGGGVPNLEAIVTEVDNIVTGRADRIRAFLHKLDTFTDQLNKQRHDITHAIDATNRLLTYVARQSDVLDRVFTELPPLIKHLADQRELLADAIIAGGRFSDVTSTTLSAMRADFTRELQLLQRPLKELGRAAPYLVGALSLALTFPLVIDNVPKIVRGDYLNLSITLDLTMSAIDNAVLTGTGFSGALRSLEQSWGRDPSSMVPDVRFSPNPADAPVERSE